MSKTTISYFHSIGLVITIVVGAILASTISEANKFAAESGQGYYSSDEETAITIMVLILVVSTILLLAAWIGALVNLGRAQEWVWFLLVFFFSGVMVFVYVIGGPQPLKARPQSQLQPATPPPSFPQTYQPRQPLSALEILQQRYARGEIDATTFNEMQAQLAASNRTNK